jgi:uncharacterized protein
LALKWKGIDTVDILLKWGADLEARDSFGNTPPMEALGRGRLHVARHLLQRGSAVGVKNNYGETVLMKACGGQELLKLVLQYGANVNATNKSGKMAFMVAVRHAYDQSYQVLELLLQSGADVNAVDEKGETAWTKAVRVVNVMINLMVEILTMEMATM